MATHRQKTHPQTRIITPNPVQTGDITITLSEFGVTVHLTHPEVADRFWALCKQHGLEMTLDELPPMSAEGGAVIVGALALTALPLILGAGAVYLAARGAIAVAPHVVKGTKVAAKGAQVLLSEAGKGAVICGNKLAEEAHTGAEKIRADMEQKAEERRAYAAEQDALIEGKAQQARHRKAAEQQQRQDARQQKKVRLQQENLERAHREQEALQRQRADIQNIVTTSNRMEQQRQTAVLSNQWNQVAVLSQTLATNPHSSAADIRHVNDLITQGRTALANNAVTDATDLLNETLQSLSEARARSDQAFEESLARYDRAAQIENGIMDVESRLFEVELLTGDFPWDSQNVRFELETQLSELRERDAAQLEDAELQELFSVTDNLLETAKTDKAAWQAKLDATQAAIEQAEAYREFLIGERADELQAVRDIISQYGQETLARSESLLVEARRALGERDFVSARQTAQESTQLLEGLLNESQQALTRSVQHYIGDQSEDVLLEMGYETVECLGEIAGEIVYIGSKADGEKTFKVNVSQDGNINYDLNGFDCDSHGYATCQPEIEAFFKRLADKGINAAYQLTGTKAGTGNLQENVAPIQTPGLGNAVVGQFLHIFMEMGYFLENITVTPMDGSYRLEATSSLDEADAFVVLSPDGEIVDSSTHFSSQQEATPKTPEKVDMNLTPDRQMIIQ
jgi:hypothetical protein